MLLCEGEKAADAAQRMFPEHVAVAWFGGTGQVEKRRSVAADGFQRDHLARR